MAGGRPKLGERTINLRAELGERMRSARENARLTQEDVAAELGVHSRRISEWEAGERPIYVDSFLRFASVCGVTVAHLVGEQRRVLTEAA
jgi:transcriptional regulator with XRE-family HTH domain